MSREWPPDNVTPIKGYMPYVEWRGCYRKYRFTDPRAVQRALRSMRNKGEEGLHAYDCEVCGGVHIGHSNRRIDVKDSSDTR